MSMCILFQIGGGMDIMYRWHQRCSRRNSRSWKQNKDKLILSIKKFFFLKFLCVFRNVFSLVNRRYVCSYKLMLDWHNPLNLGSEAVWVHSQQILNETFWGDGVVHVLLSWAYTPNQSVLNPTHRRKSRCSRLRPLLLKLHLNQTTDLVLEELQEVWVSFYFRSFGLISCPCRNLR